MLVSLYTVRVVLNTLGAEDYGIYNVVAGVVAMFGFLSGAMASASQRYFSFEIGRGDFDQLKKVFSLSIVIYILIALIVLLMAETIGLWFVSNKMAIPGERKNTALWIYQTSIIAFLFTILTAPYMAAIIAHEDMNIYAYMSIIEVILKLVVVFLLRIIPLDKLQLYGILMGTIAVMNTVMYRIICSVKYPACKFEFYWNKALFKEITSYTGWNLFGATAEVCKFQVVNVLLNQFTNPIVIASRGVAYSVFGAVSSFASNFSIAMKPQIIKNYANGNHEDMFKIVLSSSKVTFFLMHLFVLPLILETPYFLLLWLKNPPEYSILFVRLVLIDLLVSSTGYSLQAVQQATGKIKIYQLVLGGIHILNFPISFITLLLHAPGYSVMIIGIILTLLVQIVRLFIIKRSMSFPISMFLNKVILPCCLVAIISIIISCFIYKLFYENILRWIITSISSIVVTGLIMYFIGLDDYERKRLKEIIGRKLRGR
jgi:O-antigen/teichoic acid export membrane protein